MENLSDSLARYDRDVRGKIMQLRGLSKVDLAFLLEHSDPKNIDEEGIGIGRHSLTITDAGLVSYWKQASGSNATLFEEFQRKVNNRVLLESQRCLDQCLVDDWDERLAQKSG